MTTDREVALREVLRRRAESCDAAPRPVEDIIAAAVSRPEGRPTGRPGRAPWSTRPRRRAAGVGVAVALAAAVVALVLLPGSRSATRRTVTIPAITTPSHVPSIPAGSKPYDYGRFRLWLPPGWENQPGVPPWSNCVGLTVETFDNEVLDSGTPPYGELACPGARKAHWLAIGASKAPPPAGYRESSIRGLVVWTSPANRSGSLRYDLPASGEVLIAHGASAEAVAATLGPSALDTVRTTALPTTVPTSWRAVSFHGLHAEVPAPWRIHAVARDSEQGICGTSVFPSGPAVQIGDGEGAGADCAPAIAELDKTPGDGLWLSDAPDPVPPSDAFDRVDIPDGTVTLTDGEYEAVDATVDVHGHHVDAVVGLGADPVIAEEIISSLITEN